MEIVVFQSEDSTAAEIREALVAAGHDVRLMAKDAPQLWADLVILDVSAWSHDEVHSLARRMPDAELLFLVERLDDVLPFHDAMALLRPIDLEKLTRLARVVAEARSGRADPRDLLSFEVLFSGDSPAIVELLREVRLVAQSDHPVLIYGELGSGRIVTARAIHDRCMRQGRVFTAINASTFPGNQLDYHLFGGPDPLIRRVDGGTLFIDYVTELGAEVQAKLLRVIEEGRLRIGDHDVAIDVRVMVGDERARVKTRDSIRPQLFHRLKVHELDLPSLRERAGDLRTMIVRMLARLDDGRGASLSSAATHAINSYTFPGNARELAHALTHAVLLAQGEPIEVSHLPAEIQACVEPEAVDDLEDLEHLEIVAKRFERTYLLRVLRAVGGNRTRAAKILDLSRKGLWQKLKAHGIAPAEGRESADEESDIG